VLAATDFLSVAKLILFGEASFRRALDNYMPHYHEERDHQGKSNVLLFPQKVKSRSDAAIECHQRLGGLLRYYHRKAACVFRCGVAWQGASSARNCVRSFRRGRWLPCARKFAFFSWAGRPTIGIHGHKKTGLLWKSAQISFLT